MENRMMKAGILAGPLKIEIRKVPIPSVQPGMMRIRLSACGVCGSDVHMWIQGKGWTDGPQPDFHMGHEFCGTVDDPGESIFKKGDRVIFWANLYCGECDMCMAGKEHLCREVNGKNYIGFVRDGGYAEYFTGPIKNAYKLPDTVSDISAALIDSLMVAYHAVRHSGIRLHDKVLVSGSGIIAQLIGELAKKAGASLVAMSKIDDRQLAKAREAGFFDAYLDANDTGLNDQMTQISSGGFDIAFEAVGAPESLGVCMDGVKPGGKVVLIGNSITPTVPFQLNQAVLHEITLAGSVSCARKEFEETIELIASGFIDVEKYVTDIFPLDDLQKALEKQVSREPMLKSVIRF